MFFTLSGLLLLPCGRKTGEVMEGNSINMKTNSNFTCSHLFIHSLCSLCLENRKIRQFDICLQTNRLKNVSVSFKLGEKRGAGGSFHLHLNHPQGRKNNLEKIYKRNAAVVYFVLSISNFILLTLGKSFFNFCTCCCLKPDKVHCNIPSSLLTSHHVAK